MLRCWLLLATLAMLVGCEHKRAYDDAPIARDDRAKKGLEPPPTFDVDALCTELVDLPGGAIESAQKPDLRQMCRKGLKALEKDHPDEYACRCTCIRSAGDLMAVERCIRYCGAEDPERVCDHVVGVEQETNEAGVLDAAHHACIVDLKKLYDTDRPRWGCTVRCLVAATGKDDALACAQKCAYAAVDSASLDAGRDAGAADASLDGGAPGSPTPWPGKSPLTIE